MLSSLGSLDSLLRLHRVLSIAVYLIDLASNHTGMTYSISSKKLSIFSCAHSTATWTPSSCFCRAASSACSRGFRKTSTLILYSIKVKDLEKVVKDDLFLVRRYRPVDRPAWKNWDDLEVSYMGNIYPFILSISLNTNLDHHYFVTSLFDEKGESSEFRAKI